MCWMIKPLKNRQFWIKIRFLSRITSINLNTASHEVRKPIYDYDYDKSEDDNGDGQNDNEEDLLTLSIVSYKKSASWDRYLK